MKTGFENEQFYVEVSGTSRPVGNLKEEIEAEVRAIHSQDSTALLSLSAGLDSQVVLDAFLSQGLNVECVFFYMPGYNDVEYSNLKMIQSKTGCKVTVLDADPMKVRKEVDQLAIDLDINPGHAIHAYFAKQLPAGVSLVQGLEQPNFFVRYSKPFLMYGYHDPDNTRKRAIEHSRKSYDLLSSNTVLLSYLTDPFFSAMVRSWDYIKGNGLQRKGSNVRPMWACEIYVKPMQYAYYWKDRLLYFPKYAGVEKTTFWHKLYVKESIVLVPLKQHIAVLKSPETYSERFYQLVGPQHDIDSFN